MNLKTKHRFSVRTSPETYTCRAVCADLCARRASAAEGGGAQSKLHIHVHEIVFYTDVPLSSVVRLYSPLYTKVSVPSPVVRQITRGANEAYSRTCSATDCKRPVLVDWNLAPVMNIQCIITQIM